MNLLQAFTAVFAFCTLVLYEFVVVTLLVAITLHTGTATHTNAPLIMFGFVILGLLGLLAISIGARTLYRKFGEEEWF
jgi:uncharacterized membrane protein